MSQCGSGASFMLLGSDILDISFFVIPEILAREHTYFSGGHDCKSQNFFMDYFGIVAVYVYNYIFNIMRNFHLEKVN
jgi:hypothetical protein